MEDLSKLEPMWKSNIEEDGSLFFRTDDDDDLSFLRNKLLSCPSKLLDSSSTNVNDHYKKKTKRWKKVTGNQKLTPAKQSILESSADTLNTMSENTSLLLNNSQHCEIKFLNMETNLKNYNLESLFGIIPKIKYEESQFGTVGGRREERQHKPDIIVGGLIPSGFALKTGKIDIGDRVLSLNNFEVNLNNIETVLENLIYTQEISIKLEKSPIDKENIVGQRKHFVGQSLIKNFSTKEIFHDENISLDVPFSVMFLKLDGNERNSNKVLFSYPNNSLSIKLIETHGIFITLDDMLINITGSKVVSSSFLIDSQHYYIGYYKYDIFIFILIIPESNITYMQMVSLLDSTVTSLNYIHGSLDRLFTYEANIGKLEHFFSLLYHKICNLNIWSISDQNYKSIAYNLPYCVPCVKWSSLTEELQVVIDSTLNELEAADFNNSSESHYHNRRLFNILGSCIIHKDILVATHLSNSDLSDLMLYCYSYCLFELALKGNIGQLIIWREVFPTKKIPPIYNENRRYFLLVVGLKHSFLCVLLNIGGWAQWISGHISPDPFYIEQAKTTLIHLQTNGFFNDFEKRISSTSIPVLNLTDNTFLAKSLLKSNTPSSINQDINVTTNTLPLSLGNKFKSTLEEYSNLTDLDKEENYSESSSSISSTPILGRRNEQHRESIESISSGSSINIFGVTQLFKPLSETKNAIDSKGLIMEENSDSFSSTKLLSGTENLLFHYMFINPFKGIIITPLVSNEDINSCILINFRKSCATVQQVLRRKLKNYIPNRKLIHDNVIDNIVEYGVSFEFSEPNKNIGVTNSFTYWVVGKITGTIPQELYVCYHDSANQNMIEIAYKLLFGQSF